MFKKAKKVVAGVLSTIMLMTSLPIMELTAKAQATSENNYLGLARKSQYVLYASSQNNGKQLNGKNYVVNGKVVLFAEDKKIKDPYILNQI